MGNAKWIFFVGAIFMAMGIAIGAFVSHGLRPMLTRKSLEPTAISRRVDMAETAVRYQLMMGVALIALSGIFRESSSWNHSRWGWLAVGITMLGSVVFCGSLYAVSLGGAEMYRHTAPYGGLLLISGWLLLGFLGLMI